MKWTILPAVLAAMFIGGEASAAKTWTHCATGSSAAAQAAYGFGECRVLAFTANSDDQRIECLAGAVCTVTLTGSGSISVQRCVGITTDGTNCNEEVVIDSSNYSEPLRDGEWWLDVTGSGSIEIRGGK